MEFAIRFKQLIKSTQSTVATEVWKLHSVVTSITNKIYTHHQIHRFVNVHENLPWFMEDWNIHQKDFHIHL